MQKQNKNYRGQALKMLINLKDANKEKDPVVSGYVGSIIDCVMQGWEKEEVEVRTAK